MKIVHDVLKACGYSVKAVFTFTYQWNEVKFNRQVFPFVSEQYPDDVYLLVSIRPGELAHTLDNGFMSALTTSFRKQEFHSSAMDRNTTLLLSCLCNAGEQINYDLRVQLEDDPYYFKKYVFTYTSADEVAAEQYIAENRGEEEKLIETIRSCLLNPALFAAYKGNDPAQRAYAYFVELATKVTVLPIHPHSGGMIETVEAIWQTELQKTQAINLEALEYVLELDADKPDELLTRWNERTRTISN